MRIDKRQPLEKIIDWLKKRIYKLNKVIVDLRIENSKLKALVLDHNTNDKEKRAPRKEVKKV